MKHTLPKNLPGDWLAAFKMPSQDGLYERFIVIHPADGYDPFVVHMAHFNDENGPDAGWSYAHGTYCRTLERAQIVWVKTVCERIDGLEDA